MSSAEEILNKFNQFPHRGAGTEPERESIRFIERYFGDKGLKTSVENFKIPAFAYMESAVIALLALIGILIGFYFSIVGTIFCTLALWFFWRYFTGLSTPLSQIFLRKEAQNLIAEIPAVDYAKQEIILMANCDSAKADPLWHPGIVGYYLEIFVANASLHFILIPWIWLGSRWGQFFWYQFICVILGLVYFLSVLRYVNMQFFQKYVPGTNDNASGVSTIVGLGEYFQANSLTHSNITLVFTGAKYPGNYGAKSYLSEHSADFDPEQTFVLNFDSVGAGELRYCLGEGMLAYWSYDASLVRNAEQLSSQDEFIKVDKCRYRMSHFDTLPFVQDNYKCMTFIGLDDSGLVPNRKWYSDIPENLNRDTLENSIQWGKKFINRLQENGVSQ